MADQVAIIGSGLIGRAWAISFARGGYDVRLYDSNPEALPAALTAIATAVQDLAAHDQLHGQTPATVAERIHADEDLAAADAAAAHVQENTPERVEVKREVFARLDALAAPETVLASSTSGILPSTFTEHLAGRERCLVAHPINPPYLVPAVEVVPAPWTSPAIVEQTRARLEGIGQAPIVMQRELAGFLMNRFQSVVLHEAFRLVQAGYVSPDDVDRGLRDGIGLRWSFMGPFETGELNAPGGFRDYVARYGPLFHQLAETQREPVEWTGEVLDRIQAARTAALPREQLAARQEWRDRRLMALAAHKRRADQEIGE